MSRQLHLLLPDEEISDIERVALGKGLTFDEWVSRIVHEASCPTRSRTVAAKLKAIHAAAEYSFPTADMMQMLSEIEQGYQP